MEAIPGFISHGDSHIFYPLQSGDHENPQPTSIAHKNTNRNNNRGNCLFGLCRHQFHSSVFPSLLAFLMNFSNHNFIAILRS